MSNMQQQEQLIYDDLNSAIEKINAIENTAEKAVLLGKLWSQIHALGDNISRHNNLVSENVVEDFFGRHSKYNDHLFLRMSGPYTEAFAFGVPIFNISSEKRLVTFSSMDSIDEGLEHILSELQKDIDNLRKNIHTLDEILTKSKWELYVRQFKERAFVTPSTLEKGLKAIAKKRDKSQELLEHDVNRYNLVNDNKKAFLSFVNEITRYIYEAFEQEGHTCELKDLDSSSLYLHDAISVFMLREENKGRGLSVKKDEGYWLYESVPLIETKSE